jgi:hypothetical protein
LVVLLFLLVRFILNRVFLLRTVEIIEPKELQTSSKLFMVLGAPFTRREERILPVADSQVLNLKSLDGKWLKNFNLTRFLHNASSKPIAVDYFEHQIDQPQYNLQKLSLLERLIKHDGGVVVTSTAEPGDYLFDGNGHATSANNGLSEAGARWAKVLSHFWVDYREDNGNPTSFTDEMTKKRDDSRDKHEKASYDVLIKECAPRASLQEIGREIAKRCDLKKSSADQLTAEVLLQAGTYYRLIWESCSPHEKLTLVHLAQDGFLSVNDPHIQRLVRRGLIVRPREVRLMNESFRQFVLGQRSLDQDIAVTEGQARSTSNWQYTKVALSVIVIGIMVFLFATQRDLYNSTLVMLTSLAAGVPAVFKFFALFQGRAGGSGAPSSQ